MNTHAIRLDGTDTTCLYYYHGRGPATPRFLSLSSGSVAEDYHKLLVASRRAGIQPSVPSLEDFQDTAARHYAAALLVDRFNNLPREFRYLWSGVSIAYTGSACSLSRKGWKEPFWSGHATQVQTVSGV